MGSKRQNGEARKIERKAAALRRVVREEAKIGPIYLSGSDCWGGRGGEGRGDEAAGVCETPREEREREMCGKNGESGERETEKRGLDSRSGEVGL